jgi:hypothetical protein
MRPISEPEQPQRELFQVELEQIIDLDHPLVRLGKCIDWASFEEALGATYHPTQYEFGNKVSVAVSSRGGWFVGAKSFTGNPYDGHTLAEQMKQVKSMIGERVGEVHVDMGYRGHDYTGRATVHVDKRSRGRTPRTLWRWMKRRAAVEPSIGHLKTEHRLERNRLKGVAGDTLNAILSAAAMNFHKLLRACLRSLNLIFRGHQGSYFQMLVENGNSRE